MGNQIAFSKLKHNTVKDFLAILFGTTLVAIAINVFYEPFQMVVGGVTGLAIVVKEVSEGIIEGGIPLWITNLVINIPLFIIAMVIKGKDFGSRTLFATFYLSFALYFTQYLNPFTNDLMLASIFGAVLTGIGMGFVFSAFATTGGTDLAAALLKHKWFKGKSLAQILFVIDSAIIAIGFIVFGADKTLYAVIAVYISIRVIDTILEGLHFSKAALIISDKSEAIAEEVFEILDRGVTGIDGKGMYTKQAKELLLCVVSKKEIVLLKDIVKEIDENAFVIVADVREVVGEGFGESGQI